MVLHTYISGSNSTIADASAADAVDVNQNTGGSTTTSSVNVAVVCQ